VRRRPIGVEGEREEETVADVTRRGDRGGDTGGSSTADRPVTGIIGEAEADDFAADVAGASGEEAGARDPGGAIAGAAGGGTGIGDLAGGTGIGTDDAGSDTAGPADGATGDVGR
jgi:hypothetical protein